MAATHPGEWTPGDLAVILAVVLAMVGVLYVLALILLQRRAAPEMIPLAVLMLVTWLFYYIPVQRELRDLTDGAVRHRQLLPALLLLSIVVLWWLARHPEAQERAPKVLGVAGGILVALAGATIVRNEWHGAGAVYASETVRRLGGPVPGATAIARPAGSAPPDVYLIVLDEYAGSAVLGKRFGFDNRRFIDSLEALGFATPSQVRANYTVTTLSLPSLLNFSHVTSLATDVDGNSNHDRIPTYLIENNRTVRLLKSLGYAFVFFPSPWWLQTASNRNADLQFDAAGPLDLHRASIRTELRRVVRGSSLLGLVLPASGAVNPDFHRRTLAGLKAIAKRPGPKFVLAHLLLPHPPFVFDSMCRNLEKPVDPMQMDESVAYTAEMRRLYIGQLRCTNKLILDVVGHLIARSAAPPIILLTGDHGTPTLGVFHIATAADASPAQAWERLSTFGAYYLPNGGARVMPDTLTLVNLLPRVFNYYFGTAIPLSPDESYITQEKHPYAFVRSPWPRHTADDAPSAEHPAPPTREAAAGANGPVQ